MVRIANPMRRHAPLSADLLACMLAPCILVMATSAGAQELNSFAVLAGSTITNVGPTVINGNVGLWPGTAVTGFPPGLVTGGSIYANNAVALQAQNDLTTAYNVLMGRPYTIDLTGVDLGLAGPLTAGVYNFDDAAQLTGTLTLTGDADDVFIFQIGSTLTTASSSAIVLGGTVQASNVFFVVGSSATIGSATAFKGQILALTSISLDSTASIDCGAAWARNGAVTLINNLINICTFAVAPGTIGDVLGPDGTDNENAVADALDDYVAGGGTLPLGFGVLGLLTPAELAAALAQLAGEVATGVAPAGIQSMDSFLSVVLGDRTGPGVTVAADDTGPGTVSVMGYWPEARTAPDSPFGSFDSKGPETGVWNIWMAAYGGYSLTEGDAGVGSHDRTTRDYGVAFGFDGLLWEDGSVGLAVSVGGTNFSLADGFGSGHSDALQFAAYGHKDFGNAYVEGALAYGYHAFTTDRYVTIAGVDHFRAEFSAHDVAAELEAGYKLGWFIPYAAIRGHAFMKPAYSETTVSGVSTFALDYDASTVLAASTEIGATAVWDTTFADDAALSLWVKAAWKHHFGTTSNVTAGFQALPGTSFEVEGATPAADSVLVSAGGQIAASNGWGLGASVRGDFAANARSYGADATLSYTW
ncbi:MAG: Outer rane autotransporter barrel [Devosia sp.]|uniref:ice-binding family protein n=1 Tax=Devosia sp. TaxID=1871048 RepID=UPI002614BBA9|nr:ice-binding family protein [Devosia sp.]MDB5541269.1 Outer rane autotransporter barrel [Devosia sp.]